MGMRLTLFLFDSPHESKYATLLRIRSHGCHQHGTTSLHHLEGNKRGRRGEEVTSSQTQVAMEEDSQYLSPGEEHRARDNLLANQISLSCQRCLTHLHVISLHEREGRERGERERGGKKSGR